MRALQDPGEMSKPKKYYGAKSGIASTTAGGKSSDISSCDAIIVYPKLMKVLARVQRTLHAKYAHLGMPKHPTDCKRQLALACVRARKSRDKATVPEEFRKYAVEGSDTLFLINHDLGNGGFNIPPVSVS